MPSFSRVPHLMLWLESELKVMNRLAMFAAEFSTQLKLNGNMKMMAC